MGSQGRVGGLTEHGEEGRGEEGRDALLVRRDYENVEGLVGSRAQRGLRGVLPVPCCAKTTTYVKKFRGGLVCKALCITQL